MQAFTRHTGIAAPLLRANIDTDAIIPSREMKAVSRTGLADGLFAGWRYSEGRTPDPGFVLNQPGYSNATIILGGDNFGCGSSREHAVWALAEYGIRVILAPGFGGIFFNNCIANGLLPVVLPDKDIQALAEAVKADPAANLVTVNLEVLAVGCGELGFSFNLPEEARHMLLNGLDPIALTLEQSDLIDDFERRDRAIRPWAH